MRNLYEVLGISTDARSEQVHAAYRARVKEVHPDAGGTAEAFNEVALAYEVLINDVRRKRYDETGSIHDQDKEISAGAQQIAESLINQILDREDIRSIDVIAVLSAEVGKHVGLRNANIEKLDQRRKYYIDLKERFRAKMNDETFINDLFQKKIEVIAKNMDAERLALAQLSAASLLLQRYEFVYDPPKSGSKIFVMPTDGTILFE